MSSVFDVGFTQNISFVKKNMSFNKLDENICKLLYV